MPILLLIRHATNDFVKTGRLPGQSHGIHLNDEGRAQAEALGKLLEKHKIHAVYASHLERAIETALYVARPHGLPINIRPALADIDNGDFTGRIIKELGEDAGQLLRPNGLRLPTEDGRRVTDDQTLKPANHQTPPPHLPTTSDQPPVTSPQNIAIVAHSDVIKAALAHYLGMPFNLFQRLGTSPASISTLMLSTDEKTGKQHVMVQNVNQST